MARFIHSRGGIAHFTGLLARELAVRHEVTAYSFSYQYPGFLYPGGEQKDFANDSFAFEPTVFTVNSVNPISWFRTARRIRRGGFDLVVFAWWQPFFGAAFGVIARLVKMFGGPRVLFVDHNVLPHESFIGSGPLSRFALSAADMHLVHSKEDEADLARILPKAHRMLGYHPTYEAFRTEPMEKAEAAKRLDLDPDADYLLFFGFVRAYKGLMHLVEAMPRIRREHPNVRLLIVGDFYEDKQPYLERIESLGIADSVIIEDSYVPDDAVAAWFSVADLVVLPYVDATQSGIAQVAFGCERPVVVTDVGGLPEVVDEGETGFVVPPADAGAIADAVARYFDSRGIKDFPANIRERAERFSWGGYVDMIEQLAGWDA